MSQTRDKRLSALPPRLQLVLLRNGDHSFVITATLSEPGSKAQINNTSASTSLHHFIIKHSEYSPRRPRSTSPPGKSSCNLASSSLSRSLHTYCPPDTGSLIDDTVTIVAFEREDCDSVQASYICQVSTRLKDIVLFAWQQPPDPHAVIRK